MARAEPADARHRVEQCLRVGMRRPREQRVARRDLHQAAEIEHGHPVHQVVHHRHVMADEQVGQPPPLLHVAHQIEHLALDRHVERRQRLVRDDQRRIGRQRAGDRDPLALAAGELMRIAVQRIPRQAHVVHQFLGPRAAFRVRPDAVDGQRLGDDGGDRHARIERAERILEHDLDRVPRQLTRRPVERVAAKSHRRHGSACAIRRRHGPACSCRCRSRRPGRASRRPRSTG